MSREEIKIGYRVRLIHSDNKFTLLKPGDGEYGSSLFKFYV